MERRQFLKQSTIALASVGSMESAGGGLDQDQEQKPSPSESPAAKIGRPVRAVSIGFKPDPGLGAVLTLFTSERVETRKSPNQGTYSSVKAAFAVMLLVGLPEGLSALGWRPRSVA